jgi:hypothetical protein
MTWPGMRGSVTQVNSNRYRYVARLIIVRNERSEIANVRAVSYELNLCLSFWQAVLVSDGLLQ